jgi:hypothetical protein
MAKNIRALRKGSEPKQGTIGLQNPLSPHNLARALKGAAEEREARLVILKSQIDALVGERYTARRRRKIMEKLRRLRSTVSS